jgi:hypothetical protein
MTDIVLSTLLWTKLPTNVSLSPRDQILARSVSHLRPNQKLREAFLSKLDRLYEEGLVTAEEVSVSKITVFADRLLALDFEARARDLTDEQAVHTAKAAAKALQAIAESKGAEIARAKNAEEIRAITKAAEEEQKAHQLKLAELEAYNAGLARQNEILTSEIAQAKMANLDLAKAERDGLSRVRRTARIARWGSATILLVAVLLFLFSEIGPEQSRRMFTRAAAMLTFLAGIGILPSFEGVAVFLGKTWPFRVRPG